MSVYVCVSACAHEYSARGASKRALDSLEVDLQVGCEPPNVGGGT